MDADGYQKTMNDPLISIDRDSKKFAVFDGDFTIVHKFTPYENEADALVEAKRIVAEHTDKEPRIVYPRITRMQMITVRRKRK